MADPTRGRPISAAEHESMEHLAQEVVRERVQAGISRAELARLSGLSIQRVRNVELARTRPSQLTIALLAETLAPLSPHREDREAGPGLLLCVLMLMAGWPEPDDDDTGCVVPDRLATEAEVEAIDRRLRDRWQDFLRRSLPRERRYNGDGWHS